MITRLPQGARAGVVLLHGRGGSAADILGLLDHARLSGVAAAAPQAPGQSWWPTSFLAPSAQIAPHLQRGLIAVSDAVQVLTDSGIPRASIWLAGFSQGACLALEAFARQGAGLGGVLAFSGGLLGTEDTGVPTDALYGHADKRLDYGPLGGRVWMSVHQRDPHIPLKRIMDSAEALTRSGAQVQSRIYDGAGHLVMPDDIDALRGMVAPAPKG